MRKRSSLLFIALLVLFAALGTGSARADHLAWDWHIADAFIEEGTGIDQTGARAADRGDVISVVGTGTFDPDTGEADGGGTFEHRKGKGKLIGFGTWEANGVQDFALWGCGGEGLPDNFCGGVLALDVTLFQPDGTPAFDGVLTAVCLIGNVPPGAKEGITLELEGSLDFDKLIEEESGLTLYVSPES